MKKMLAIAILGFILTPFLASADYVAFQNRSETGALNSSPYTMYSFSTGTFGFRYDATSTVTQFDRIDIPLCRTANLGSGELWLEVRTGTSTPVLASSTIAVNSGNIYTGALCTTPYLNATTTTFVLNNNLQWVNDVMVYFTFRAIGTSDTFYFSQKVNGSVDIGKYTTYQNGVPLYTGSDYLNMFVTGRALGIPPTTSNIYSGASSTSVICQSFDIGCYVSNAIAWAFIPSDTILDNFITLKDDLKNKPPFGYFVSASTILSGFDASSSPAFLIASSSPINTYIFNPMRSGLSWLLIVAGLYWLYKRLTNIHI